MSLRTTPVTFDVSRIPGPFVISGAGGFVGAHLLDALSQGRNDVIGFGPRAEPWRIGAAGPSLRYEVVDDEHLRGFLERHQPKTIINMAAAGAYSFQTDSHRIPHVNIALVEELATWAATNGAVLIHAGSSSE